MLTKNVEEALNKQIGYEAYASNSYLSMASWCDQEGLRGCTAFFYEQSEEERMHMLKIVKYVNQAGGYAKISAIEPPAENYQSIKHVFETALKQEQEVSKQINNLVELSFQTKDFATYHFLQWYVQEQLEEETLFNTILDIIRIGGEEEKSLLLIDNEISKIRSQVEDPGGES
jgi:ferritin